MRVRVTLDLWFGTLYCVDPDKLENEILKECEDRTELVEDLIQKYVLEDSISVERLFGAKETKQQIEEWSDETKKDWARLGSPSCFCGRVIHPINNGICPACLRGPK